MYLYIYIFKIIYWVIIQGPRAFTSLFHSFGGLSSKFPSVSACKSWSPISKNRSRARCHSAFSPWGPRCQKFPFEIHDPMEKGKCHQCHQQKNHQLSIYFDFLPNIFDKQRSVLKNCWSKINSSNETAWNCGNLDPTTSTIIKHSFVHRFPLKKSWWFPKKMDDLGPPFAILEPPFPKNHPKLQLEFPWNGGLLWKIHLQFWMISMI